MKLFYQFILVSPSLGNLFHKMDRFETAAIFGILTSEILKVFDEILLAISEASADGVMIIFLKRMVIVILIGLLVIHFSIKYITYNFRLRYFPILISLRVRHVIVRLLTFIYILGIIAYTIYRESFCLDFLPHSKDFSAVDEIHLRIVCLYYFLVTRLVKRIVLFSNVALDLLFTAYLQICLISLHFHTVVLNSACVLYLLLMIKNKRTKVNIIIYIFDSLYSSLLFLC
jgi:hypothetical protein